MSNTRILADKMQTYHKTVEKHLTQVDSEFQRLHQRWLRLRQNFAGDSADEFRPVWEGTERMFREYSEAASQIQRILAKRIEDMKDVNRREGM